MAEKIKILNRYTSLEFVLDMVARKKLVLLDPEIYWDDKNDTKVIEAYKEKKGVNKIFAVCFSFDNETIHHWKTFSNGSNGCCIQFNANRLIKIFDKINGLRYGKIEYKRMNEVNGKNITYKLEKMPFIKRYPYHIEKEYRAIWEGETDSNTYEIDISLDTIESIIISQQMPEQVFQTIKKLIIEASGSRIKRISRSTIYENRTWIEYFKNGVHKKK